MGWRDFLSIPSVENAVFAEIVHNSAEQKPQKPQNQPRELPELNMFDPEICKNPRPDLMTEAELAVFSGWFDSYRKPEFGMSNRKALQKAWELTISEVGAYYRDLMKRDEINASTLLGVRMYINSNFLSSGQSDKVD